MHYELWHVESANLMDAFDDESEALDVVRAYLTPDQEGRTVDVALMVYDHAGQRVRSLEGVALAALAFGPTHGEIRQSA
jgi:hypothetical protein